jgi:hypothetical protein
MNEVSTTDRTLKTQKSYRFAALRNLNNLKVFVLLAITIWIAYFWHSASFGLYSDDFRRVGYAMEMTWSELGRILQDLFLMKQGQGRPLHDGLIYLLSFIGFRLGGLHVVYWIGYAILTVNAFLFYTLLKRLSDQQVFAVTGALAFCLFPAHTVQTWLTIALAIQPALMLLLIAIHCYLSDRKKLSYLFILGSLLCYETFFPLFLAAPLFKYKWNSKLTGKLIKHGLILAGMFACVALLRKLTGEGRVANLELLDAIKTSILHTYIGPIASLKTFLTRPLTTLKALAGKEHLELWLFLSLCFAGLVWVLSRLKLSLPRDVLRLKTAFDSKVLRLETAELFDPLAKLASIGIIMWVLAYPLTLTRSPSVVNGQTSRLHLAGSVGASILVGCICSIVFLLAAAYGRKRLATVGLAAFFALLVGFGLIGQQDYMLAWQYQRQYWTDAISLIPDLDEETVIFVDREGFRNLKYITGGVRPNETLTLIYRFPDNWEKKQLLELIGAKPTWWNAYIMNPNWQENIVAKGNSFQLNSSIAEGGWFGTGKPKQRSVEVESSKVILLEIKDGRLTRRTEPLIIDGKEFPLKGKTATGLPPFEKGPLYDYLIKSPDEERINYIDESINSNKSSRSMLITEERQ